MSVIVPNYANKIIACQRTTLMILMLFALSRASEEVDDARIKNKKLHFLAYRRIRAISRSTNCL